MLAQQVFLPMSHFYRPITWVYSYVSISEPILSPLCSLNSTLTQRIMLMRLRLSLFLVGKTDNFEIWGTYSESYQNQIYRTGGTQHWYKQNADYRDLSLSVVYKKSNKGFISIENSGLLKICSFALCKDLTQKDYAQCYEWEDHRRTGKKKHRLTMS